jgi:fructoselysine-6-P-deglycase FrlB-like protein
LIAGGPRAILRAVTDIEAEIARQPRAWREVAELGEELSSRLVRPGERVAFVGCGSSWFAGQTVAALRERLGAGTSDAFCASELPVGRRYDTVVAISRSGETTEAVDALERSPQWARGAVQGTGAPEAAPWRVALTTAPGTPLVAIADDAVVLEVATEEAVVETVSVTSVVALWLAALGVDVDGAIEAAETALSAPLPDRLFAASQHVLLGTGHGVGLAHEGALKLREAAGAWAESYPASELRHGPLGAIGPHSLVWSIGELPGELVDASRDAGAGVVPTTGEALADVVLVQRSAVALARRLGRDPAHPPRLERAVVLR